MAIDTSSLGAALTSGGSDLASLFQSNPNFVNPAYATPQQAAQLRAYGNALLKQPTTIHRPAQGFAMLAQALVGGNALHDANQLDQGAQQSRAQDLAAPPNTGAPTTPAAPMAYAPDANAAPASNAIAAVAPQDGSAPTDNGTFSRMIGAESNGQQFAPDGSTLTSPKGAQGIAQIMPSTGPEAAEAAGVPYDADRLANDPAYNKQLGQAYYNKQLAKYGDPAVAAAAYNAGPGAVDNAMAKAQSSGGNYLSYLPTETQNYVGKVAAPQQPANGMLGQAPPNQVAQNGGGMTMAQARTLTSPYSTPAAQAYVTNQVNPQIVTDGGGNKAFVRPGDPNATPIQNVPGVIDTGVAAGGASAHVLSHMDPRSGRITGGAMPTGGAGGLPALGKMGGDINNTNADSAAAVSTAASTVQKASQDAIAAQKVMGPLNIVSQQAQQAGYGVIPNLQAIAGQYGINTTGLAPIEAFNKSASALAASSPEGAAFAGAIPSLSTSPGGRQLIMQNLTNIAQRQGGMSKIVNDDDLTTRQKAKAISELPPAKVMMPTDVLNDAKAAIAQNPSARAAIVQKVQAMGLPVTGL